MLVSHFVTLDLCLRFRITNQEGRETPYNPAENRGENTTNLGALIYAPENVVFYTPENVVSQLRFEPVHDVAFFT